MEYTYNTTQDRPIVHAADDTSDTLLYAHTIVQPVCTAADSPTANSGGALWTPAEVSGGTGAAWRSRLFHDCLWKQSRWTTLKT